MRTQTLIYYLKLLACEGVGVLNARKLLDRCQEVSDIFDQEKLRNILENQVLSERLMQSIHKIDSNLIADELDFIVQNNIQYVGILEEQYPRLLKECADAPIVLFYKGDLSLLNQNLLSIVGTRKITPYGKEVVENL
ncbi:MAG TPA: DNA-processing protein DprA, partial [Flavobacterium sp.]|nr:DNA-processing protein DprA [Flavobacterium sp.]